MDWREVRTRLAWGGAFLVAGCVVPQAAQRWLWPPVRVTVVNGSTGEVLRDVEVVMAGESHAVGELGSNVSHQIPLQAASAGLPVLVRFGARGRRWETRSVVPAGACCGDRLRLAVAPELRDEPFVLDTP
ncbi:hypothetical protein [Myxococcus sp. RHSTA-1-4]|uniref:hypothetical protein n=1 Tax=Myxococcus sp. RHSTA-1-4 TaxID=2874601 RepID=UPI001CBEF9B9|nr:hypothetical protein [Myxococcus sp. RHSTA-1-4]MBZ4420786.1 hypothetical protein [Myxococcus sp. RHSTA-1-4]